MIDIRAIPGLKLVLETVVLTEGHKYCHSDVLYRKAEMLKCIHTYTSGGHAVA